MKNWEPPAYNKHLGVFPIRNMHKGRFLVLTPDTCDSAFRKKQTAWNWWMEYVNMNFKCDSNSGRKCRVQFRKNLKNSHNQRQEPGWVNRLQNNCKVLGTLTDSSKLPPHTALQLPQHLPSIYKYNRTKVLKTFYEYLKHSCVLKRRSSAAESFQV